MVFVLLTLYASGYCVDCCPLVVEMVCFTTLLRYVIDRIIQCTCTYTCTCTALQGLNSEQHCGYMYMYSTAVRTVYMQEPLLNYCTMYIHVFTYSRILQFYRTALVKSAVPYQKSERFAFDVQRGRGWRLSVVLHPEHTLSWESASQLCLIQFRPAMVS